MGKKNIPYDDRDDLTKMRSQWNKINGIFEREKEWSAAIVRAATSAEIAANIVVRKRFESESEFSKEFVDSLLIWANGLDGKFRRLIIPAERDVAQRGVLQGLKTKAEALNKKRNSIVHGGTFASRDEARKMVKLAHEIAIALVLPLEPNFTLKMPAEKAKRKKKV